MRKKSTITRRKSIRRKKSKQQQRLDEQFDENEDEDDVDQSTTANKASSTIAIDLHWCVDDWPIDDNDEFVCVIRRDDKRQSNVFDRQFQVIHCRYAHRRRFVYETICKVKNIISFYNHTLFLDDRCYIENRFTNRHCSIHDIGRCR